MAARVLDDVSMAVEMTASAVAMSAEILSDVALAAEVLADVVMAS